LDFDPAECVRVLLETLDDPHNICEQVELGEEDYALLFVVQELKVTQSDYINTPKEPAERHVEESA